MPLISSAAPGKKAAPKAPARRRPAALAQAAVNAASADPTGDITDSAAPLSPPPTQNKPNDENVDLLPEANREADGERDVPHTAQDTVVPSSIDANEVDNVASQVARETLANSAPEPEPQDVTTTNELDAVSEHDHALQSEVQIESRPESQSETQLEPQPVAQLASEPEFHLADRPEPHPESHPVADLCDELSSAETPQEPEQTRDEESSITDDARAQIEQNSRVSPSRSVENQIQAQASLEPTIAPVVKKRSRTKAKDTISPRPEKRAKRSSTRSSAAVQAAAEIDQDVSSDATAATRATETTAHEQISQAATKVRKPASKTPKKPTRKPKSTSTIPQAANSVTPAAEESPISAVNEIASKRRKQQQRKLPVEKDVEAELPSDDDPESHEIDVETISMFALSHDTTRGKTSEREKKMATINWDEIAQKRKDEAARMATGQQQNPGEVAPSNENTNESDESRPGAENQPSQGGGNLQFTMDSAGNIVADEASLNINRNEEAEAAARRGDPVEDENDLTVKINRTSWVNNNRRDPADRVPMWKSKSDPWSEEDSDKFYDALRMFGTDFDIISKMFPGKTRKHVKLKFTREERLDPTRINDALMGKETRTMDLEHYARETGKDISAYTRYDGVAHALSLINESMKDKQVAMTAAATEVALHEKQRAEKEKQKVAEKKQGSKKSRKNRGGAVGMFGGEPADGEE